MCVCGMAVCECDPLFQCCCSFAAVHIMSSHLLLSHSVSLFFSPLISLLFFFLLSAAHKLSRKGGAMRVTQRLRLLPPHSANQKRSRVFFPLEIQLLWVQNKTLHYLNPKHMRSICYHNCKHKHSTVEWSTVQYRVQ